MGSLGTTIVLAVCLLTLAGIIVFRQPAPPIGCATGVLRVVGSTAFAPAMEELARRYAADCPGSEITVDANGSNEGVRELAEAGDAKNPSPALLALSDGPKPASFTQLREDRVAIAAFALVVNDKADVKSLTTDQIRGIYRGDVVNWKELGGPDLPIRLVSRDANSGTRDLLRRRILDGQGKPAFTSRDCENKNSPAGQDHPLRTRQHR
jgi:phosphate transport system substrate-binding protein